MKLRLVTFGISHYCEKARWALDWHGIEYEESCWPPGVHLLLARRLGAARSTLPILCTPDGLVQDSSTILEWAEAHSARASPSLSVHGAATEAEEIEQRVNEHTAVQVRRHVYAVTLARHSHIVKPALFMNTTIRHRLLGELMWPITRQRIRAAYAATAAAVPDSRARLERDLDWLDAKLADGRRYMVGDRFSRVDLTVASLLAALSRPPQVPQWSIAYPSPLSEDLERWSRRPILRWVNELYARHRYPEPRSVTEEAGG